jgi:DNA ligase-1
VTQNGRAARYLVPSKLATVRSKPVPPPKPAAPATAWTRLLGADPFGDDPPPPVETVLVTENEEEGESKFAVLLAESWDGVLDPTGYLMSEKLDGVRAYWDGRVFRSRLDNIFRVPEWYLQHFPKDLHLDGEFWIGRKRFQETSGFVRRHDQGTYWQQIQFRAFDLPMVQEPFSKRYDMLKAVARKYNEVKLVEHQICRGIPHLRMYLDEVEKLGGEGVMLRKANSLYVRARSDTLVKVKTFYDAEAYVTGYTAGKGKHKGRVGALECKSQRFFNDKVSLNAGVEFNLGTGLSDKDRRNPPAIGTVITYRFQDLSNKGVPQKTSYVGRRDYE